MFRIVVSSEGEVRSRRTSCSWRRFSDSIRGALSQGRALPVGVRHATVLHMRRTRAAGHISDQAFSNLLNDTG